MWLSSYDSCGEKNGTLSNNNLGGIFVAYLNPDCLYSENYSYRTIEHAVSD